MKQLLTLILLTLSLLAGDARLKSYPQAQAWEKTAENNADSAYNLGYMKWLQYMVQRNSLKYQE